MLYIHGCIVYGYCNVSISVNSLNIYSEYIYDTILIFTIDIYIVLYVYLVTSTITTMQHTHNGD